MDRIDTPGATAANLFTVGNPFAGIDPTIVGDEWLNDLQEELIRVINATAQVPTKGNQAQILLAIIVLIDANMALALNREVVVLAPTDLTIGDFFGLEDMWGIAKSTVLSGAVVTMTRMGQFTIDKLSGEAFTIGQSTYWDTANDEATIDGSGSNKKLIGHCAVAAGGGDATASIYLSGDSSPIT